MDAQVEIAEAIDHRGHDLSCVRLDEKRCPDCGQKLQPQGRCMYCPCCGWSRCL